ncbi:MAG TPA: hypothetical protein VFA89_11310 [Terriglobales bacterium]|nr:hypothetical protein [Terriglobales bacterium]
MDNPNDDAAQSQQPAAEHVASAHQLLQTLRARIGEHPELGQAITKLEMALNLLAVNTGGML